MSQAPARVLLLGIDAASPDLVDRWMADGTLPHLRALADRGLVGRTRGVEGFFIGSTWPSLYTGTNPARHGVHYLVQIVPGSYRLHRCAEAAFVRGDPFWRVLSRAGRRVAILDVPLTRLEPELDGIQVVEWGGHDSLYGLQTSPPELGAELVRRFGAHPLGTVCDAPNRTADDYRAFVDGLELGVSRKTAWTRELLSRGGWDLFAQVFTEAHCAGHQCWHLHDTAHPAHDAALAASLGDPLRRVYRSIDTAVGELIASAGDATVVVFSAHGMSHWFGAQFLLPQILVRLGVTVPLPERSPGSGVGAAARAAWRALPPSVRGPIRTVRQRLRRPPHAEPRIPVDAGQSLCFPLANGLAVGGIRLNLVGREPDGRLRVGMEVNSFVDRLTADLLGVIDERTGRPLIRRVVRTADLHAGDLLDHLPDLLVEWSDEVATGSTSVVGGGDPLVRARSPKIGMVEGVNDYGRTGENRPDGWFIAAGSGIGVGRLEREISIMDLAPTLTAMLGVEMTGADGVVVPELVSRDEGRGTRDEEDEPR